jgi:hypothetical protein
MVLESIYFQYKPRMGRQIVVTKPKAINLSTQSTEKHHKKKNILNVHQVRLLAQFSYVFVGKATVFSQNYFARQCRLL